MNAEEAVAKGWEIVPELRARAELATTDRRLPRENVEALRRSCSLKTIQAMRNGGYGLGIRSHVDVIRTLGRGCGSTAWVAGVAHAHSWLISHFPEAGQDEIYSDPDALVSAVIGPRGRAVRTADGYSLTGVWPFGSGCENADWLLLGCVVVDVDGNEVDQGDVAVRQSDVTIRDDWFVSGLKGTGSCTMEVTDLAVGEHLFVSLASVVMRKSPGASLHAEWVQNCAAVPVGVRLSSPLCRAYDDLQAINNHGLLKVETNLEMYGRLLVGQPPNTPLI